MCYDEPGGSKTMGTNLYLLSFSVAGIRNIRSSLRLDFYKRTVNKSFEPGNYRTKAIYGENGSGKSALITAVQILKDLICDKSCLEREDYQEFLGNVINKQDQKLRLECEYYYYTEPADQVYHYAVTLDRTENGAYRIASEELTVRKADYPNSKVTVVYNFAAGSDDKYLKLSEEQLKHVTALNELGNNIYTNIKTPCTDAAVEPMLHSDESLEKFARFIRVIKPDLLGIKVDGTANSGDDMKLQFVYDKYEISADQESSGIRRLLEIYPFLEASEAGRIVFIDEIDTNINEVVFDRIIAYFSRYGKGQLCVTAQNSIPMTELKKGKNAIDFLSTDGKIIPWRTRGNFSPENLYRGGMIESLPFNIEAEDLLGLL